MDIHSVETENMENNASAVNVAESINTDDKVGSLTPPIESKDVVDVPEGATVSTHSVENAGNENSCDKNLVDHGAQIKCEANIYGGLDAQSATKRPDDIVEHNEDITEEFHTNELSASSIASAPSSIGIENNKMAAEQSSTNGDIIEKCESSLVFALTSNTTDEGISMENSNDQDTMNLETPIDASTVTITAERDIVAAPIAAINTDAAKKSKSSRRSSKKKRSQKDQTNKQPSVEMATDDDVYELVVTPRQREYQLKVKNGRNDIPADNCEIFCSNIPINVLEEELVPLFDRYGKIWTLRLLMSRQNPRRNAGFAFVRYTSPEAASEAVKHLSNYEVLPGKQLMVRHSQPNLSLFVGNINRNQTNEQVHTVFSRLTKGLVKTVVKSSYYEENKNCGFCFLEYESHAAALTARSALNRSKVWGRQLFVDWSQRRAEIDVTGAQGINENKTLFISNLPRAVSGDVIQSKLTLFGEIDGVTVVKDYAFVEFKRHDSIIAVLNGFNAKEAFGSNDTEMSFALKRPLRNRNGFARHSKSNLGRFGSQSRMYPRPGFQKRRNSAVQMHVTTGPQLESAGATAATLHVDSAPEVQEQGELPAVE